MDLSLEHCGSEEHLKVERMCIITVVFWDKFSGNDSFLKKQVITVGNSKYLRTLRERGGWKQKLVIACNQFASVYLLWFRHIKWLLSLRGERSLLLNLDLRDLALAERSVNSCVTGRDMTAFTCPVFMYEHKGHSCPDFQHVAGRLQQNQELLWGQTCFAHEAWTSSEMLTLP